MLSHEKGRIISSRGRAISSAQGGEKEREGTEQKRSGKKLGKKEGPGALNTREKERESREKSLA